MDPGQLINTRPDQHCCLRNIVRLIMAVCKLKRPIRLNLAITMINIVTE
jgi:hypothetical protein